ncbi:hypothetical protein [Paramaledivibacter caminithermalis]|jgi:hypothetical protein|uniref:Nucleotidyltransferase domain-containing protein n=1 Tax=Paramaledivibacter caminithermalis (strain DSM 15212 / CIP 107654 / DViRD3) TaxID=1121301 RepID=A0A1M6NQ22_PARC5|nr:hypothetical protein [Paramaledivibacter caminithermalis]SHJ97758.1 hypothetical protein SAMN02745912_01817 [Paramaledivibacter caminithermalis DSM 15212]
MKIKEIFDKKIKNILEGEKVLSILLIGAGANIEEEDFHTLRDIDLFVITHGKYEFERELITVDGVLFDVSYMSYNSFEKAIYDETPFLINSLQSYKFVYNIDKDLAKLLDKIRYLYKRGPQKLKKDEIDYIRFKLYQDFTDILGRKEDLINTEFLMNNLFYNILTYYYKLHGYWIPKDKKILKDIQKIDKVLYNLSIDFIGEELDKKIEKLNTIMNYVLKPYGGVVKFWKRNSFPII